MQEEPAHPDPHSQHPLVVIFYATLLFLGSQLVGSILVQPLMPYLHSQTLQVGCYTLAGLLAAVVLLQFNPGRESFWQATGLKKTAVKNYLLVVPVLFVYAALSVTFAALAVKLIPGFNANQAQDVGLPSSLSGLDSLVAFISLVILTPLLEEIIFRGVLFRGLRKRLPFWGSALITSGLFALAHAQWNVGIDTFVLSLALCYLVEKSDSILPSVMLHASKNFMAFLFLFVIK